MSWFKSPMKKEGHKLIYSLYPLIELVYWLTFSWVGCDVWRWQHKEEVYFGSQFPEIQSMVSKEQGRNLMIKGWSGGEIFTAWWQRNSARGKNQAITIYLPICLSSIYLSIYLPHHTSVTNNQHTHKCAFPSPLESPWII